MTASHNILYILDRLIQKSEAYNLYNYTVFTTDDFKFLLWNVRIVIQASVSIFCLYWCILSIV